MKIQVKHFAAKDVPQIKFEDLFEDKKSTLIAKNSKTKVEYWFDPKTSTIYGYDHGKTTAPISEFGIKDQDYLDAVVSMLKEIKDIKFA